MAADRPRSTDPQARAWQYPQGGSSSGRASSSKRAKIVTWLAVMAGLAGIIIVLLLWIDRFSTPFFLSIPITEYGPHFPPIPFAEQDSEALREHFSRGREAFESQEGDRLLKKLAQLAERKEDAVVVHLCAYGVCRDSDVYIIPAHPKTDGPNSELPLREVLRLFGKCPARHKLLILDIMRPLTDARLGILINPVAARTLAILKEWDDQNRLPFFVLCPCSRGEVSLVWEELARSVFGYYLSAGLSGQADGWNREEKRDQRVSVHELFEFVRYHVDRWAVANRGSRQIPVLFGKAKDFPLIAGTSPGSLPVPEAGQVGGTDQNQESPPVKQESPSSAPSPEAERKTDAENVAGRAYPPWLMDAWEVRDRWWKDKLYRIAPRGFRQLEGKLVRAEQRWRARFEAGRVLGDLDLETPKKLVEQAQKSAINIRLPSSLAAQNLQPDAATDKALRDLLAQQETNPAVDTKTIPEANKKRLLEAFKNKAPQQLAWTVFGVAADDLHPSQEKIRLLLDIIKLVPGIQAPPFDEIDFLQKLGELKPDDEGKWPTEAAHHGMQVVRERGKALGALRADPRVLPWVQKTLEAAAGKRREGEKLLFAPDSEGFAQAAPVLENTERDYNAINGSIEAIVKAQSTYDEALAALPGLAPYFVNRPELEPRDGENWQEAIRSAQKLRESFDRRMREPVYSLDDLRMETAELSTRTEPLRRSLQALERPFHPDRLRDLTARTEKGNSRGYLEMQAEMQALLESPRLAAKERKELYGARRRLAQRLREQSVVRDEKESLEKSRKMPPVNPGNLLTVSFEEDRARRRARMAIDLLKLGGVAGADDLDKALDDKPDWQALGDKLLEVQAIQLPQQFTHLTPKELAQADRLSRVFHPFDRYPGENSNDLSNPAAQLLRQKTQEFQTWLSHFQP